MSFTVLASRRRRRRGRVVHTKITAVGPGLTKKQAKDRANLLYKRGYDVAVARTKIIERKIHKRRKKKK